MGADGGNGGKGGNCSNGGKGGGEGGRRAVRCRLVRSAVREAVKRSQKSANSGRSMALRVSGVAASTDTYNWVMGRSASIAAGNCAPRTG